MGYISSDNKLKKKKNFLIECKEQQLAIELKEKWKNVSLLEFILIIYPGKNRNKKY